MKGSPTGPASPELSEAMQRQGRSFWFQSKLRFWRWVRCAREQPESASFLCRFENRLRSATVYQDFKNPDQAKAGGWAGLQRNDPVSPGADPPYRWKFLIAHSIRWCVRGVRFLSGVVVPALLAVASTAVARSLDPTTAFSVLLDIVAVCGLIVAGVGLLLPRFGSAVLQHELFHAAQDLHSCEAQPRFWGLIAAPAVLAVIGYAVYLSAGPSADFPVLGVPLQRLLAAVVACGLFFAIAGWVILTIRWPAGTLFANEADGKLHSGHALLIELEAFVFGWLSIGPAFMMGAFFGLSLILGAMFDLYLRM